MYSNNPNKKDEKGKTPKDYVWVFTYEVDNNKLDGADGKADDQHGPLHGAGFTLYATKTEGGEYQDPIKFKEVTEGGKIVYYVADEGADLEDDNIVTEMTSQADGSFNIKGLRDGTYYLVETHTPDKYNTCDPVVVEISSTHDENGEKTGATMTLTKKQDGKDADANKIINNKGSELPETGGIGTTIFYVLGGILVLCCGVVLIAKKRVSKEF